MLVYRVCADVKRIISQMRFDSGAIQRYASSDHPRRTSRRVVSCLNGNCDIRCIINQRSILYYTGECVILFKLQPNSFFSFQTDQSLSDRLGLASSVN